MALDESKSTAPENTVPAPAAKPAVAAPAPKPVFVPKTAAPEPEYDAAEFIANSRALFGYSTDIASAAFALNRVKRCTLTDAKRIVKTFAERKIK